MLLNIQTVVSLIAIGIAVLAVFLVSRRRTNRGDDVLTKTLLQEFQNLRTLVNDRLRENVEIAQRTNQAVGERLDNAARVVGDVRGKLGKLEEATSRMLAVGEDISSLQEILSAPKLRGGLGELFLGDLLSQILPPEHFSLQHRFANGETVDAVVRLRDNRLVSVDSKFPLENFRKMLDAEDEPARLISQKQFVSDVKRHIDAIRTKYIRTDEGTFDFALMYIPAENVYYETILKGSGDSGIMHYAHAHRVIPVSPNTFYIYLQSIMLGLQGLQIERGAKDILENLKRLQGDFERFGEDYSLLGKHLNHARGSYDDAAKRLTRFREKLSLAAPKESGLLNENADPNP